MQLKQSDSIIFLQNFCTENKAKGMVAELSMWDEFGLSDTPLAQKLFGGAWILSPKSNHYLRHTCFVLPEVYPSEDDLISEIQNYNSDRNWQTLATFLKQSEILIVVSGAITDQKALSASSMENLVWQHFLYQDEQLVSTDGDIPFHNWGGRGRASRGSEWSQSTLERFYACDDHALTRLALKEAFYNLYIKKHLRLTIPDAYDVDGFIIGFSGRVFPLEVKEKSRPPDKGEFGVDAGRILMLLRLCLATNSNALYLIREIDDTSSRKLMGWRYITLADLIMKCRWNVQGGGRGMTGGSTQTIMMPGELFQPLTKTQFSEEWIAKHSNLKSSTQRIAKSIALELQTLLESE